MLADAEGLHTSSTIVWDRAAVETPFPRVVNGTLYVFYSARGVESDGHTEFASRYQLGVATVALATVVLPRGTGTSTGKIKRMLPNAARKPAPVFVKAANAVATSQKRTRLICRSRETGGFCPRKPRPSYSAAVGDQWPRFDSLLHGTRDTMLASYQRPASKVFARQTGHFLHD